MMPRLSCPQCPGTRESAFACLEAAQRSLLAKTATPHAYDRGQTVFHQGTPALAVFCIRSGSVKLVLQVHRGEPVVVALRTKGDLFGYRAVLAGICHEFTAETIEPSVVCTIPREDFLALLDQSHALALHLLKRLARAYHFAEEQLVARAGEPVERRTARFLVSLSAGAAPGAGPGIGVPAPKRREDLAQILGTTSETLSRTLHGLAKRGLIRVDRREIQVVDLERLRRLSG